MRKLSVYIIISVRPSGWPAHEPIGPTDVAIFLDTIKDVIVSQVGMTVVLSKLYSFILLSMTYF